METINTKVPSTIEAAALCKMADRGQITGALVDGPLALDNAIDLGAAKIKKIQSPVAGQANVLVVPDLEAGNMLAKSLTFLADADAAGICSRGKSPHHSHQPSRLHNCRWLVRCRFARSRGAAKQARGEGGSSRDAGHLVINAAPEPKFQVFEAGAVPRLVFRGSTRAGRRGALCRPERGGVRPRRGVVGRAVGHEQALIHLVTWLRLERAV